MQIRMKTTMAGPSGCFGEGSIVDVEEAQARSLISGGYAEALLSSETCVVVQEEIAVIQPAETRGKRRK